MATTSRSTRAEPLPGGRRAGTPARALALLKGRPVARSARNLAEVIGAAQPTVAEALKVLRRRGLVEKIKCGTETRYRILGAATIAGRTAPHALRADRPRLLGFRSAWLREQERQALASGSPQTEGIS
jgi:DNA-binding transcriptional ArsR family regulator